MELWFSENHTENVKFSFRVKKQLFSGKSKYQQIDVFDTFEFGRVLTLDGCVMVTEKDEFVYHEMITHVPMAVNKDIQNVLVIGAGDGGTVRELTRYNSIKNIDMVEIDELVVSVCKEFIPLTASKLEDSRVNIFYEDGLKYVRTKNNEYDLIIIDSTDPFGPSEGLFTKEFYQNCYNALNENGILVNQHDNVFYSLYDEALAKAFDRLNNIFTISKLYQAHIPTYPSGHWLFGFASKRYNPLSDLKADYWWNLNLETKYYNPEIHQGCFYLPSYVMDALVNKNNNLH